MSKNIQAIIKIILIFIVSIVLAWLTRKIFSDLYIAIAQPKPVEPILFMMCPTLIYNFLGFLISYALFASILSFLFIDKKQWWGWLVVIAPLLIISWGMWEMYLWYLVFVAIGWLLAQGGLIIYKKIKK